jgi:hypothetical protein
MKIRIIETKGSNYVSYYAIKKYKWFPFWFTFKDFEGCTIYGDSAEELEELIYSYLSIPTSKVVKEYTPRMQRPAPWPDPPKEIQ